MNGDARDSQFDVDPEAWRKQFWGNDGALRPGNATAKPNGADSDGWSEPDMGVLRLRRRTPPALPLEVSAIPGADGLPMRLLLRPARSIMSLGRCSRASRR